jgi:hypothetical protein
MCEISRKFDIDTLNRKHFLTDLRARLYLIALNLAETPDFREQAINEIDLICDELSETTPV